MSHSLYLSWLNEGLKYDMLDMHLVLVIIEFCQLNKIVLENVLKLLSDHWSELVTIMEEARLLIDEPSPGERWCLVFVFLWSVSNRKMNPGKRVGGTGLQCPRNRPNGAKGLGKLWNRIFSSVCFLGGKCSLFGLFQENKVLWLRSTSPKELSNSNSIQRSYQSMKWKILPTLFNRS